MKTKLENTLVETMQQYTDSEFLNTIMSQSDLKKYESIGKVALPILKLDQLYLIKENIYKNLTDHKYMNLSTLINKYKKMFEISKNEKCTIDIVSNDFTLVQFSKISNEMDNFVNDNKSTQLNIVVNKVSCWEGNNYGFDVIKNNLTQDNLSLYQSKDKIPLQLIRKTTCENDQLINQQMYLFTYCHDSDTLFSIIEVKYNLSEITDYLNNINLETNKYINDLVSNGKKILEFDKSIYTERSSTKAYDFFNSIKTLNKEQIILEQIPEIKND